MLRVIAVRTGTKYSQWYVDNLKHMIDNYSNLQFDKFEIITKNEYDDDKGVFNKLQMFDMFRDGQNIYFDLDVCILNDCNLLLKKDFTLCHAWWRKPFHTPLNSSIVSWQGDKSYIFNFFKEDPEYYMFKYSRGIDSFIYENFKYKRFTKKYKINSIQYLKENKFNFFNVILFNQSYTLMNQPGWWSSYFFQR